MRAVLHRAAKSGIPARGLVPGDGRHHRAALRSGAHASRWAGDELATPASQSHRLRAERRARHNSFSSRTRVGPSELYGYDAHRNITFLTDTNGVVTATYDYDAWGNLVASTGSTPNTRVFAGAELDLDLELVNLRARYYNPRTGRFLAIDPLDDVTPVLPADFANAVDESRDVGSQYAQALVDLLGMAHPLRQRVKRYLYAGGDPVDQWDPSGFVEAVEDEGFTAGISGALIKDVVITTAKGVVIGGVLGALAYKVNKKLCDSVQSDDDAQCYVSCVGQKEGLAVCLKSAFQRWVNCKYGQRPGPLALCGRGDPF
jgi:RHS repeat-associated protein